MKTPRTLPTLPPPPRFESPPGSGSNDGGTPAVYDVSWQFFVNLTPEQIRWFQAQPEWQNFVEWVALEGPAATTQSDVSIAQVNATLAAANIAKPPITSMGIK